MASKQLSWMDEKTVKGESPRQRLQRIAAAMGIHPKHIEFVLTRFGKLKDTGTVRGRAQTDLILAAAYDYLRWEGSGLQPKSPKDFIAICKGCGIRITRSRLLMSSRLFKQAGLYPKTHLTVEQLLDKRWKPLKEKYALPENLRASTSVLAARPELVGRTPEAALAASVYIATVQNGMWVGQRELAKFFGITEVSLRNAMKRISAPRNTIQFTANHEEPNQQEAA